MKLKFSIVFWNRWDEKFGYQYPFLLTQRNINNYGWNTLYSLYKVMPEGVYNIPFNKIHIFKKNQPVGEQLSILDADSITGDVVSCITDEETAQMMLLFMTYKERLCFINTFNSLLSTKNWDG